MKSFCPIKNDSASDKEEKGKNRKNWVNLHKWTFLHFWPFQKYTKELKDEGKDAYKSSNYQDLRNVKSRKAIIVDMFDYEFETTGIESNVFTRPIKLKLVFDFIDFLLQLLDKPIDESFKDLCIHVDTIRECYDKNALPQSNKIISCRNPSAKFCIVEQISSWSL